MVENLACKDCENLVNVTLTIGKALCAKHLFLILPTSLLPPPPPPPPLPPPPSEIVYGVTLCAF